MKIPITLSALILATGILWSGYRQQSISLLETRRQSAAEKVRQLEISSRIPAGDPSSRTSRRDRSSSAGKIRETTSQLLAMAASAKNGDGSQLQAAMAAVAGMNADEIQNLINGLRERTDLTEDIRQELAAFCLSSLAQQNPQASIELLFTFQDLFRNPETSQMILGNALPQWAKENPAAAAEWLRKNIVQHPEWMTQSAKESAIAATAGKDPALALQLITDLKIPLDETRLLNQITMEARTPEQQAMLFEALRSQLKNPLDPATAAAFHKQGLDPLYATIADSGYDSSQRWMQTVNPTQQEKEQFIGQLEQHASRDDSGKWLDWLSSQPLDKSKSAEAASDLVRRWTQDDYVAAGTWLSQAPTGPLKESATLAYLQTVATYDPDTAVQWAATLPSGKQSEALNGIHRALRRKDPAAAAAFATQHGLTPQ